MNRGMLMIRLATLTLTTTIAALATGCGSGSDAYAPSSDSARGALTAALEAWKKGAKPVELAVNSTPVHPVDFQWLAGVGLKSYEIVSEEPQANNANANTKLFVVSLGLEPPRKPTQAKYLVTGQGPIWVYREEDFARALNMDNNPAPTPKKRR